MPNSRTGMPVSKFYRDLGIGLEKNGLRKQLHSLSAKHQSAFDSAWSSFAKSALGLLVTYLEDLSIAQFEWRSADSRCLHQFLGLQEQELPPGHGELAIAARIILSDVESSIVLTAVLKLVRQERALNSLAREGALVAPSIKGWERHLRRQVAEVDAPSASELPEPTAESPPRPTRRATSTSSTSLTFDLLERISVIGSFERGGFVRFEGGQTESELRLPRGPWAVFALLVEAAKSSELPEFSAIAPDELCSRLRVRTRATSKPLYVDRNPLAKYILRLRKLLEECLGPESRTMISTEQLGYRLTTSAELVLRVQDAE